MKKRISGKKAVSFLMAILLLTGLALACVPGSAAGISHRVFSFFGLRDFSDCADSFPVSVHVISVGKADSILVQCGSDAMLVDGGTADRGKTVAAYLKHRGITQLNYIINTHPDDDHVGGLAYILSHFTVQQFIAPAIPESLIPATQEYANTYQALAEAGLKAYAPKAGEIFSLGALTVQVLGPVREGDSTNNNSIVLRLGYEKIHFLLMGDAEKEEEADLLAAGFDLSANVLKVGHHGSNTSTTQPFLSAVSPQEAAISVGRDSNNLPNREILQRLSDSGATVYRTDIDGTLIFLTDGKTVSVQTEK